MSSQYELDDSFLHTAASKGFTPDSLPALRQYVTTRDGGNLEAARRIEANLRAFFEQHDQHEHAERT
jgi:uncharacterized membrane protein YccC